MITFGELLSLAKMAFPFPSNFSFILGFFAPIWWSQIALFWVIRTKKVSFQVPLELNPWLESHRYAKANMAKDASMDGEVARMTAEDLAAFMAKEQKTDMGTEECEKLIQAFEPSNDRTHLSMEGIGRNEFGLDYLEVVD